MGLLRYGGVLVGLMPLLLGSLWLYRDHVVLREDYSARGVSKVIEVDLWLFFREMHTLR